MKCKICGENFVLDTSKHYISRDEKKVVTGLKLFSGTEDTEVKLYDTFDCPKCGCQNIVQERKREWKKVISEGHPDEVEFVEVEKPECYGYHQNYIEVCRKCKFESDCKLNDNIDDCKNECNESCKYWEEGEYTDACQKCTSLNGFKNYVKNDFYETGVIDD